MDDMKPKTHQATAKRLHVTKRGTVLHRAAGQDHFNARESGVTTRGKRRDRALSRAFRKTVSVALPGR